MAGTIRVRGIRQTLPSGKVIGRKSAGAGPAELIDYGDLGRQIVATGAVSAPGGVIGLISVADGYLIANVTGSPAMPVGVSLNSFLDHDLAATASHVAFRNSTGWVSGSLTQPSAGLTITGGVGGFTFALADDLAAVEGLSGTGLAVRTATGTWTVRTITGTSNRITLANGDGVAGAPSIDISTSYVGQATITTLGTIATGTWAATKIGLAYGGTNADLSATGGTGQVLKQATAGAAITVSTLASTDISNFDDAAYWAIADAIGVDDGDLADQVFGANLDLGDLSGCGNTATAGFTAGDEGLI